MVHKQTNKHNIQMHALKEGPHWWKNKLACFQDCYWNWKLTLYLWQFCMINTKSVIISATDDDACMILIVVYENIANLITQYCNVQYMHDFDSCVWKYCQLNHAVLQRAIHAMHFFFQMQNLQSRISSSTIIVK